MCSEILETTFMKNKGFQTNAYFNCPIVNSCLIVY